jgi:hypothetical protein
VYSGTSRSLTNISQNTYFLGTSTGTEVPLYRAGAGYLLMDYIFRDIFHNVLRNA